MKFLNKQSRQHATKDKTKWMPVEDALIFGKMMQDQYGMTVKKWYKYINGDFPEIPPKPANLPKIIPSIYNISWKTFFAKPDKIERMGKDWMPIEDALEFGKMLHDKHGISSLNWREYVKGKLADKPPKQLNLPQSIPSVYKIKWSTFFGTPEKKRISKKTE